MFCFTSAAAAFEVIMQVDDNMMLMADGVQMVNTLCYPPTWQLELYKGVISDDTFVLAIKAYNRVSDRVQHV